MHRIVIDPGLQSLIPSLTDEEHDQLEANILKDGCREPLSVMKDIDEGGNPFCLLLDGHNRYEICEAHGLPYGIREITGLASKDEIRLWIINNQLGRRNLSPDQIAYYRGEQYKATKAVVPNPAGRNQHSEAVIEQAQPAVQQTLFPQAEVAPKPNVPAPSREVRAQNGPQPQPGEPQRVISQNRQTAEALAEMHGVSKNTIKRDAQYADALNRLASFLGADWQRKVLAGTSGLSKADIIALAELPDKRIKVMADGKMDVKRCAKYVRREKRREEEESRPIQLELSFVDSWRSRICEAKDALDNGDQDTVSIILTELLDQLEKVIKRDAA